MPRRAKHMVQESIEIQFYSPRGTEPQIFNLDPAYVDRCPNNVLE